MHPGGAAFRHTAVAFSVSIVRGSRMNDRPLILKSSQRAVMQSMTYINSPATRRTGTG